MSILCRILFVVCLLCVGSSAQAVNMGFLSSEADLNPNNVYAYKVIWPNGTISVVDSVLTVDLSGLGGGDMGTIVYDTASDGKIDVAAGGTAKASWTQYAIPYLSNTTVFGEIPVGTANYLLATNGTATGYGWTNPASFFVSDCTAGPCLDGSSDGGHYVRLYAPVGGNSTYTEIQGGNPTSNIMWRLPLGPYPNAGLTSLINTDSNGNMGLVASTTYATATHAHAGSDITSGTVGASYLPAVSGSTAGIVPTTNSVTDGWVITKQSDGSAAWAAASGGGYTNLTSFVVQTAWRLFYSDGSGDVKELALGADGEYLKSNGATSVPSWATPSGAAHDAVTLSTDLGNNLLGLSTQQITLDNQNANIVFAGPSTGSAAAPSFRSLVAADIPSLATTYAVVTGTPETTFQIDNNASGPKLKFYDTKLEVKNAADDDYYDIRVKDIYAENINSTKADGAYYANFDNTVAITFTPYLGYIWSQSSGGASTLYFYDGSGSRTVLNSNSTLDDDKVAFDDADNLWTATTIGAALEELNDSINAGAPNGTGAKLHWSQLLGVPAGFADGTDDGGGFSPTTYDDITWGAAAGGSQTWTWDTGSGTDPNMVVSDSYFTFNKIIQCAGIETTRSATVGGSVRIGYEGSNNGDNYIDVKAPDARDTSLTLLYPTADPSAGQVLSFGAPSDGVSTGTWLTPQAALTMATASDINTGTDTSKPLTSDALAGSNLGVKEIGWTIKDSDVATAVADGKQAFVVPAAWNGMNLVDLTCAVADLNSAASGATTVVLRRVRGATAVDMTSTGVTINYDEYSASDETVDTSNDDIATGDKIYVDVNAITTAAHKGLSCTASFQLP